MRPSLRSLEQATRLVLFTRANCSLCETAKSVVSDVRKRNVTEYSEIDIMASGNEQWKSIYEFDVPVVQAYIYL